MIIICTKYEIFPILWFQNVVTKKLENQLTFARVLVRNIVAQEQINAVLLLRVAERVSQISAHGLHNIVALRRPGSRLAIRLDAMHQLRSAVL